GRRGVERVSAAGLRARALGNGFRDGDTERWIIRVARGAASIEGIRLGCVERCCGQEARGQVGVGDEKLAEGDGVRRPGIERFLGTFAGEALVGDVDAAERGLELRAYAVGAHVLAGADESDPASAELSGDVAKGGRAVGVSHGVRVAARSQMHADAAWSPDGYGSVCCFQQQPRTILNGAAVVIVAVIAAVL